MKSTSQVKTTKSTTTIPAALADRARAFRLSETATPEILDMMGETTLNYQDKVLLAGYCYNGVGQNSYFGAVYTHTDDDLTCEGEIRLTAISEDFFPDNGTAIAWAIGSCR